jgi:uncharacterized protein (TIGR03382 family)
VFGTDPTEPDTDGDGLTDGEEVRDHATDPLDPDSDDDGLSDGEEILEHGTDPLDADTDDGGVSDGVEVGRATDPLDPSDDYPADPDPDPTDDTGFLPRDDKMDGRYAGGWANCGCASASGGTPALAPFGLLVLGGLLRRRRGEGGR